MNRIAASVVAAAALVAVPNLAHADTTDERSPALATGLSIAGTVAGPLMIYAGSKSNDGGGLALAGMGTVVLGPSLGEWYSGKPMTWGLGMRAAGAVMFVTGAVDSLCFDECGSRDTSSDVALLVIGAVGVAGGTVYDILDAAPSARSWNAKHQVEIAPTVVKGAPGLTVAGKF